MAHALAETTSIHRRIQRAFPKILRDGLAINSARMMVK